MNAAQREYLETLEEKFRQAAQEAKYVSVRKQNSLCVYLIRVIRHNLETLEVSSP